MTNEKFSSHKARRAKLWLAFAVAAITMAVAACSSAAATVGAASETPTTAAPQEAAQPTLQADQADSGSQALNNLAEAADQTFAALETLLRELGPRESATGEELSAAQYLVARYEELGYLVELQPFTIERVSTENSGVAIESPVAEEFDSIPLSLTGIGSASGPLAPVGLARTEDLTAVHLTGKIALVRRGTIPFQDKVAHVFDAGAVGAVIYNNQSGNFRGTLSLRADIPVLAISRADGERIEAMLEAGAVVASVAAQLDEFPSRNVVVELDGPGDGVVVLGAHYDTVAEVAGANDNGSGTAIVLSLAEALAGKSLPFDLKIVAFGSEELGLLGSRHYIESLTQAELRRTKAMLNFDAVGTGPRLGILGNQEFTDLALDFGDSVGVDVQVSPGIRGGSSDHAPFAEAGVPVLMFFSSDFSRIHTPADNTLDFIEPELLGSAVRVASALLQSAEFAEAVAAN